MPGPRPPEIVLSDAEHHELERLVCAHKTGQALVRRARVVLLAGMGYGNTAIAEQIPLEVEAVGLWRRPVQRRVVPVERANLELLILASMEALAQMDDHCAPAEALKSLVRSAVQGELSRFLMGWLEDGSHSGDQPAAVPTLEERSPTMDDQTAGGAGDPEALPKSPRADPIAGEFVTETLDYDGGRQVTVYVPPDPPEVVVFAGDGQGISRWGWFLEAAAVPSTMIVGVHGLADETLRLQEYSPVFDAERFAAHERFFVEDVGRWARSRFGVALPAERTAVFGVSAGGELALALGLRHPDVYGAVFSGSPGAGYKPTGVMPSSIPRVYLVAGTLEPFFLDNATRWAVALRDAGADVVMSERVASHGDALWQGEFPLMVAWAFGR